MSDGRGLLRRGEDDAARRWLDLTRENHIFIAPTISFAAFVMLAIGDKSLLAGLVAFALQVVLFQIAVTAHLRNPRVRRVVFIATPILFVAIFSLIGVLTAVFGSDAGRALASLLSAALTAGVILRIFGRVVKAPVVDVKTVVNAITVYLMLGLVFSYLYIAMSALNPGTFFVQGEQATSVYLYFSYITLATIGYGDFTPDGTAGRFMAVAEGLMGQLYLVTILAVIVSNLGRERNPIDVEAPPGGDEPPDAPA